MADTASDASPGETEPPLLVCLHWLGGSARSWDRVAASLTPFVEVLAIDLPGFGDAEHHGGRDVAAMAEHVAGLLRARTPRRWMLAGHSMGAKVATAVARQAEDGGPGLDGLSHIVLVAGSPPAPEPMAEDRRDTMLGWFRGGEAESRREAQTLIDNSVGSPLDAAANADALDDVLRLNRHAWTAWLEAGSREDWSGRIGTLETPALLIAGGSDADLGAENQGRLMARHFTSATLVTLPDTGHLAPIERPDAVADAILRHVGLPGLAAAGAAYRRLIASDRVSARTRAVLVARAAADDPARAPKTMDAAALATLRAVVDRIVPQAPEAAFDIAARMDEDLATQPGDGWRFIDLPPDAEAYRAGLATLDGEAQALYGVAVPALSPARCDALLARVAEGRLDSRGALTGAQMKLWFQDVCANAVRSYVSHPATLARMGYSGIGYGGDGPRLQGFSAVGVGRTESWEPQSIKDRSA